jgi:hypothetical protein
MTIDSIEASNGIMSYSAELKFQLEHIDKLEFNMLRKNNYVNLTAAKIPSWYITNMSDCVDHFCSHICILFNKCGGHKDA